MKVLLVNTYHYHRGGDCTYTFSLADTLRAHGNDVSFFGMKHPHNYPCPQEPYFVDCIDYAEAVASRNLVSAGKVITRSIYSVQARKRISMLLDDIKPDVAHFQSIHAHLTPSIITELKKRRIPIVWTLHDYKILCPNTTFLSHGEVCERCKTHRYYNVLLHKCKRESYAASTIACLESYVHRLLGFYGEIDSFIAPSRFLMHKFIEFGFDEGRITHLPYLLGLDEFKPGSGLGDYCVYAGRLSAEKGIMTLLKAMKVATNLKLTILGEGPLRNDVEEFVRSNEMINVTLGGYKRGAELRSLIGNALFCIVPSEWYENYPYAVMEAMSMGMPVISTSLGGLPELVDDGTTGFLFEAKNHDQLAARVVTLAGDPELRKEMGMKAFEKARMLFDPELHYRKIIELYSSLL